jgi:hypothetical protein
MREGWIPAFDAVRSRLRDPNDQTSIQQCKGVFIKLCAPAYDGKEFESALRRLGQFKVCDLSDASDAERVLHGRRDYEAARLSRTPFGAF